MSNGSDTARGAGHRAARPAWIAGLAMASALAWGMTAPARAGTLYIANPADNTVLSVSTSGGTPTTYATGLNVPIGLVFDSAGNLYVSNLGNGTVVEVPAGASTPLATPIASGLSSPNGLAIYDGNLYIANNQGNSVVEVPLGGGTPTNYVTGIGLPVGLAFDSAGNLFISANNGGTYESGTVDEVPHGGGTPTTVISGLTVPEQVTFDSHGNLFTIDGTTGSVIELPLGSTTPVIYSSGYDNQLVGLAFDSAGDLFVSTSGRGGGQLYEVAPGGGAGVPFGPGLDSAGFLTIVNTAAVPEPSLLAMAATGAAALAAWQLLRRRRPSGADALPGEGD